MPKFIIHQTYAYIYTFDVLVLSHMHAYIDTTYNNSIAGSLHICGEQIYPKDLEVRMLHIQFGLICVKPGISWTAFR
jgi:hypothetical protein